MMAARGDRLLERFVLRASMKQADASPGFILFQAVQVVAGGDTGLAAGAGIQINRERVLLAAARRTAWEQLTIDLTARRRQLSLVVAREAFHGRQALLFRQQFVNEGPGLV
jgi:hypothetical protein